MKKLEYLKPESKVYKLYMRQNILVGSDEDGEGSTSGWGDGEGDPTKPLD